MNTIFTNIEKSNTELANQVAELKLQMTNDAKGSNDQRAEMLRNLEQQTEVSSSFSNDLRQLGGQLSSIFNIIEKTNNAISTQIIELMVYMDGDAKGSHKQRAEMLTTLNELAEANNTFRNEMKKHSKILESFSGTTDAD